MITDARDRPTARPRTPKHRTYEPVARRKTRPAATLRRHPEDTDFHPTYGPSGSLEVTRPKPSLRNAQKLSGAILNLPVRALHHIPGIREAIDFAGHTPKPILDRRGRPVQWSLGWFPGETPLGKASLATRQRELLNYINEAKTPFDRARRIVAQVFPKEEHGLERHPYGRGYGTRPGSYRPSKRESSWRTFNVVYKDKDTGMQMNYSIDPVNDPFIDDPKLHVGTLIGNPRAALGTARHGTNPRKLARLMQRALAPGLPIETTVVNPILRLFMQRKAKDIPGYLDEWNQYEGAVTPAEALAERRRGRQRRIPVETPGLASFPRRTPVVDDAFVERRNRFINREYANNPLAAHRNFSTDHMPNGLIRITDQRSGLSGLYHPDGRYRSGDLHLNQELADALVQPIPFEEPTRPAATPIDQLAERHPNLAAHTHDHLSRQHNDRLLDQLIPTYAESFPDVPMNIIGNIIVNEMRTYHYAQGAEGATRLARGISERIAAYRRRHRRPGPRP